MGRYLPEDRLRKLIDLAKKLRADVGDFLTAMEFFSNVGLDIALENIPELHYPLERRSSYYLLVEVSSGSIQVPLESIIFEILEWGMDKNIIADGSLASSEAQRLAFWRLREEQPEGQRRLGPQIKNDLSVPPRSIANFLRKADMICNELLPEVRINPFGHLGDGNIHYNLSPPLEKDNFSDKENLFLFKLAELATSMSGSFSAEHGLGRTKVIFADQLRDSSERKLMQSLKYALDEQNQLNPGVLVNEIELKYKHKGTEDEK